MQELPFKTRAIGRYTAVTPAGEIVGSTFQSLKNKVQALIDTGAVFVVIDFSEVSLLGSIGLAVVIKLWEYARAKKGDLRVICSNRNIRDVFTVTGTDLKISIYANEAEFKENTETR